MNPKLLQEFLDMTSNCPSGYLASYNGSGFKIRNDYFGHLLVDEEINYFNYLLNTKSNGLCKRVGGNEWLAYFPATSLRKIQEVMDEFYEEKKYNAGWACLGERGNERKVKRCTVKSQLLRAVRSVYTYIDSASKARDIVVNLVEQNWNLPPNTIHKLSSLAGVTDNGRKFFSIIEAWPVESPSCPFCGEVDFDWIDGDASSAYGICKNCRAEVTIGHAESPSSSV